MKSSLGELLRDHDRSTRNEIIYHQSADDTLIAVDKNESDYSFKTYKGLNFFVTKEYEINKEEELDRLHRVIYDIIKDGTRLISLFFYDN